MKIAKQSASSTGIWLVLLNLPPHLRYLPENMFLAGVIPGPGKPSLDQINHSLQLVVNDLLEFWNPGVFFTRTYNHERGMLYNAMLVPLVADMTAARQVLGLPGSLTAYSFCSFCDLDLRDIDIFDKSEWPAKNVEDIRRMGQLWKEAPTEKAQDIISTSFGQKWSALLDLPYWNPVDYAVVKSMHALDIGLFQHHCRDLFKIDMKRNGGDASLAAPPTPINKRATNKVQKKSLSKCLALIKANSQPSLLDNLLAFERKILYIVCIDNDIIRPGNTIVVGTRWLLANDIYRWRHSDDPSLQAFLNPLPDQPEGTTDPDDQSEEGDSDEQSEEIEDNNSEETTDDQSEAEGDEHSETGEEEQVEEIGDDHLKTQEGTEETHTGPTKRSLPEKDELDEKFYKAVAKVISLLVAGEDEKARRRGTKKIFAYILEDVLQMDLSEVEYGSRPKQALFDFFLAKIADDSQILEELKLYIPGEPPVRAVLGKDIMEAVWDDMKRTQLPTWIRPGPPDWGTAARGKLSADQWRVNCVIHLVITLIRLWGHDTGRRKELLDHYMELVNAVVIANIRIMSPELIKKYKEHIVRYAEGCLRLYPEESIRPNLHVALHLDEVFDFFGPNHAISAPFYERYINFFHRMNTNKKLGYSPSNLLAECSLGELESTFMTSSARTSALRAILADDEELRELVHEVIDVLEATEREDARGYCLASLLDPTSPAFTLDSHATQIDLDDDTHRNLSTLITTTSPHQAISLPKQAMSVNEISISGVSYGTSSSTKYRNSNIIFHSPLHQPVNRRRAGSVRSIFQYTHHPVGLDDQKTTEFFVVVKEYLPMDTSDGRVDPYKQYGFVAGYLCDPDPWESYVIRLVDVVSHFVLTDMVGYYDNLIHVLPVDRVAIP
ncbi:hypothetical protein Hypma_008131 [Hypsizygus marmoreus]|uniref:Uncharacterized protein n=1 Tax=Hypsizygus marmoreus TaxID=39966 RepID=A0A369JUE1_HYPMA|nr:hypothetical protein Hypma_008131 [Hypsizygus marmoreus]